ncbi:MAG: hypothetical protein FWF96_03290, partial [Kiritimatiellaeota bacterium]|nr:hypothetical protein [Kiritimatiellota bacterium]
ATCSNVVARHMVMVVRCAPSLRMRETLVCAEEIVRLAGRPLNAPTGNAVAALDTGLYCGASWRVDGVEGAPLVAGGTHLLEISFSRDVKLETLGLGSDTGRVEWKRAWGGAFLEVIGFDAPPSADALAGIRHYLRLKWGLADKGIANATSAQHAAARGEGVNLGAHFGTLLIVR